MDVSCAVMETCSKKTFHAPAHSKYPVPSSSDSPCGNLNGSCAYQTLEFCRLLMYVSRACVFAAAASAVQNLRVISDAKQSVVKFASCLNLI